ncbi:MAG: hypothetical protein RLZZ238_746 [Planctomycetota bacterium]|jgi:hypothetical protein
MDPDPQGAAGTMHAVCFEEAGECTLRYIASVARAGDRIVVLGPRSFAARVRSYGGGGGAEIRVVPRTAPFGYLRLARACEGFAVDRTVAYGTIAQRSVERALGAREGSVRRAGPWIGAAPLPVAATWPAARRERMRRTWGVRAGESVLLIAAECPEWLDLGFVSSSITMARASGARLRVAVAPGTPRLPTHERLMTAASDAEPAIVDARFARPWDSYPAVDVVLVDRDGALTHPSACAGWRMRGPFERALGAQPVSPLPALWALAYGIPVAVHASIDLGEHAANPLVSTFDDDVASLARALHARASSPSAASR